MSRVAALALLLLVACGDGERQTQDVVDSGAPGGSAGSATSSDPAQSFLERAPQELLVRRGACPFECCVYGRWRADTTIVLLEAPRAGAAQVGRLERGTWFEAATGEVHVTGGEIVVVHDTTRLDLEGVTLVPGDTLLVLDYLGEGYWNLLYRGVVLEGIEQFWSRMDEGSASPLGEYAAEWWIQVRLPEGGTGWFRADGDLFSGADACGGPVEEIGS